MKFGVGQPVPRIEDARFLTGTGRYVDDIALPGQAWGHVLRSPYAAADIRSIDVSEAAAAPGVLLTVIGDDLEAAGVGHIPCGIMPPMFGGGSPNHWPSHPVLARDRVRHVGEPVAFVVAETRAQAEEAADLILVDFDEREPAISTNGAGEDGSAAVWDEAPDNLCFEIERGDLAATDAAFASASHHVVLELTNNRVAPSTMEPRACAAVADPADGRITLYTASQNPHGMRPVLAQQIFGIPETEIRVISPDVGGGFGMKNNIFPEDVLCIHAARSLKRPVRWTSTRAEAMLADHHGRDMVCTAELALDNDGRFLGLRAQSTYALGAYLSASGPVPPLIGTMMYAGTYHFPALHLNAKCVFTNTAYTGPYRGAGRPEATHIVERLVDEAARVTALDPIEIRRRNFISPKALPYQSPLGVTYDTGEFEAVMDKAVAVADWGGYAERKSNSEAKGLKRGRGVAYFIEISAIFNERMELRFEATGALNIVAGTHSHGQGHETVYRQMISDWLGVDFERIRMQQGDTDKVPYGRGTYASRSVSVGGSALQDASLKLISRAKDLAGMLMEAAPTDIEFSEGRFEVSGTDKSIGWTEILAAAFAPMGPTAAFGIGLEAVGAFAPQGFTFPNGCHVVEVEVDPETGLTTIDRYCAVDDSGVVINPLLYAGQIQGGIAQGVGQALLEDHIYDPDSGQLLTGSFLDYGMPRADDLPMFVLDHHVVPSTNNPLGTKGAGESGTVGAPPAVVNAVVDALADYGVRDLRMPITPKRVWQAIQGASSAPATNG